jgi:Protein of unknown function (DUF2934)
MESSTCPASAGETAATVVFVRGQVETLKLALEEEIRVLAYQNWEAAQKPKSDGIRFWLEAEHEILHGEYVTA